MARPLDPLVQLATNMHAQPGVYAVLLGSGVSNGAGVLTGWGVVEAFVRQLAAVTARGDKDAIAAAAADPEAWWAEHHDGATLGYSDLLESVGPTPTARRALLSQFFKPTVDEYGVSSRVPSAAHRSIAALARRGYIRVILTTNFDPLMEDALRDEGVAVQIASRADAITGLTPLRHAGVTLVKLHGDYTEPTMLNTPDELSTYSPELQMLLKMVFEEYGLVISGWSAVWDHALVTALKGNESRRYQLYWDSRSSTGEEATDLLARRQGTVVPADSADELFTGLLESVDALEQLAEPPLATALAVARFKRYLLDPTKRVEVEDLILAAAQPAIESVRDDTDSPVAGMRDGAAFESLLAGYRSVTEPLLALLTAGVNYDRDRDHLDVWVRVVQRLLQARTITAESPLGSLAPARHYPALLAFRAAGILAAHLRRDDVLIRLATEPTYREEMGVVDRSPGFVVLRPYRVVDASMANAMPRWDGGEWIYPPSHLLRVDLREALRPYLPDDDEYRSACDRYEYLNAVLMFSQGHDPAHLYPEDFLLVRTRTGELRTTVAFTEEMLQANDAWPWWPIISRPLAVEKWLFKQSDLDSERKSRARDFVVDLTEALELLAPST